MRNLFKPIAAIAMLLIALSCKKDEVEINVAPTSVTNINAELISDTMVRITWDPSTDENKDPIQYELIVNTRIKAQNINATSFDLDITEFLPSQNRKSGKNGTKGFTAKDSGLELVLGIEVKAYDDQKTFSNATVIKTILVNRPPGDFDFVNIYFDTVYYNSIEISWSKAIDKDDDDVTYTVYLNDIVLTENYKIVSTNEYGFFYYNSSFASLVNEPMTIKIIASDGSTTTTEISETFDFNATDVDLGTVTIPYSESFNYTISAEEPDNKISYIFTITEETAYKIQSPENYFTFRDASSTNSSYYNNQIQGANLQPGTYYIELINNNYPTNSTSGTLIIQLADASMTDEDLTVLETPSSTDIAFDLTNELDGFIIYSFEILEETGYYITSNSNNYVLLTDTNGNPLGGYSNTLKGTNLSPGTYELKLETYYYYSDLIGNLNIVLSDPTTTDQSLGILDAPSLIETTIQLSATEPDNKIGYSFEITRETGYTISLSNNYNAYINLIDANGNYINNGSSSLKGSALPIGNYTLEIEYYSYDGQDYSDTLSINLTDFDATDITLGVLTLPYSESMNYTILANEPDGVVAYEFEITENTSSYFFSIDSTNYITLKKDGGFIKSGYQSMSGETLTPGVYSVEISNSNYYNNSSGVFYISLAN